MEQMRSEFEAWWHSAERGLTIINFGVQRELQWAAWQASRAAIDGHNKAKSEGLDENN